MTLAELKPRWWGNGPDLRQGITFLCPCCRKVRLGIAFANPLDGAAPSPIVSKKSMPKAIAEHLDVHRTFDVPPGFLWQRSGDDFAGLSLSPSVDASAAGHWHGWIRDGAVQ